jgi:hypothetical protein
MAFGSKDSQTLVALTGFAKSMDHTLSTMSAQMDLQIELLEAISSSGGGSGKGGASGLGKTFKDIGEGVAKGGEGLQAFAKGVLSLSKGLLMFSVGGKKGGKAFVNFFEDFLKVVESRDLDDKKMHNISRSIQILSGGVLKFGGTMALYSLLAVPAMVGATLFGLTIRLLLKTAGIANDESKSTLDGLKVVVGLSRSILLFGVSLMLYVPMAPIAMVGAVLFGLTVNIISAVASLSMKDKKKNDNGMKAINGLSRGMFLFGLTLILAIPIFTVGVIGAALFGLSVFLVSKAIDLATNKNTKKGVGNLILIAIGVAAFGLSLAFFNSVVSWEAIPKVALSLLAAGLPLMLIGKFAGDVAKGALAMTLAALPIAALGFSIGVFQAFNIEWETIGKVATSVLGIGLLMSLAGMVAGPIALGSLAMTLAALPIVGLAFGLGMWEEAGITWSTIGQVGATVLMIGTEFAIAGLVSPLILLGSVALGLGSIAIIGMSYALKKFKETGWTPADTDNLKETIAGVFGALTGTGSEKSLGENVAGAVGQGLQAILALMSIGPLILGSAAIWLMSTSLEKFKSTGWTQADNTLLGETISGFLSALQGGKDPGQVSVGGSILNMIVSFMSVGSIFAGAAGVWLLSDALLKFKKVKWSKEDSKTLSFTINEILTVMKGGEEGGGLWGAIKGAAKGLANSVASAGNATSIGLAGLSIGKLADALMKWQKLKWDKKQTKSLTDAISGIIKALKDPVKEGEKKKVKKGKSDLTLAVKEMTKLANLEKPIERLAKSMGKFAKETAVFAKSFGDMDQGTLKAYSDLTNSLIEFSEVETGNFSLVSDVASSFINKASKVLSGQEQPEKEAPSRIKEVPDSTIKEGISKVESKEDTGKVIAQSNESLLNAINMLTSEMSSMKNSMANMELALGGTINVREVG